LHVGVCVLLLMLFERSGDSAFAGYASYNERGRWLNYFYGS
jgi:hypothetical protein